MNEDVETNDINVNGIRHIYCDETWSQNHSTCEPSPLQFEGGGETINFTNIFPTILQL